MKERGLNSGRRIFLKRDFERGFIKFCGFKAHKVGKGFFTSRLKIRPEHRQQDGFIHAGVMATMADHTAGYAAFTLISEKYRVLTIEFKINFLKPASGEILVCKARILKEGKLVMVAESEVFDSRQRQKRLVAKAVATLMVVPAEKIERS
jgi:uncharacterized protein (TIGR00369 family)